MVLLPLWINANNFASREEELRFFLWLLKGDGLEREGLWHASVVLCKARWIFYYCTGSRILESISHNDNNNKHSQTGKPDATWNRICEVLDVSVQWRLENELLVAVRPWWALDSCKSVWVYEPWIPCACVQKIKNVPSCSLCERHLWLCRCSGVTFWIRGELIRCRLKQEELKLSYRFVKSVALCQQRSFIFWDMTFRLLLFCSVWNCLCLTQPVGLPREHYQISALDRWVEMC